MPLKPATRSDLIEELLDDSISKTDREIAARALLRMYPAVTKTFSSFVQIVLPMGGLNGELFDLLSDAFNHVHPKRKLDV